MIKNLINLITSALFHPPLQSPKEAKFSFFEAGNDYAQGEYFERLASYHHQSFVLHLNDQPDLSPTDYRNAMWNFLRAALKGHKEAQYKLGIGYLKGELGLERNFSLAEQWLRKAAAQGHTLADYTLLHLYDDIVLS